MYTQCRPDIRWQGAANPIMIDIAGLNPASPYEIQLLTNGGAGRNRPWENAAEGELVVDDYTSKSLHAQVWAANRGAYDRGVDRSRGR